MSYADRLRARADHYAQMSSRTLDTSSAALLGLLAIRLYHTADMMEA